MSASVRGASKSSVASPWLGRLGILAAAVLWSSSGWFAKNPVFDSWPAESRGLLLAFWRALFAGLLILPLARPCRLRLQIVPLVICFTLMNAAYLSSAVLTSAANAIWLQSTAPLWVMLAGVFVLKETIRPLEWLLFGLGMAGVAIILFFEVQGQQLAGVGLGVLSGAFYAGVVLFLRSMAGLNAIWVVASTLLLTAALLAPWMLAENLWPQGLQQWLVLAAFGLFQLGLPYVLFTHGLRTTSGVEAAGIALVEPILVPLWVYLSWGEVPAWWSIAGGTFILCGLIVRLVARG